jgi:hypothetical protein
MNQRVKKSSEILASDISRILSAHLGQAAVSLCLTAAEWRIPPPRPFASPASVAAVQFPSRNSAAPLAASQAADRLFPVPMSASRRAQYMHAWLAGCPVLESLLLLHGCKSCHVASEVSVWIIHQGSKQQLVIEDAPCMSRKIAMFGGTQSAINKNSNLY